MDRETFAICQAGMTARWYENVKSRESDVAAYIARREAAYLDRWREAARFVPNGARILDVGGGNLFPALLQFLSDRCYDYWYLDVDAAAVEASRSAAAAHGLHPEQFTAGFNDQLAFPADAFDAVFSSHCIEHSIDLAATLRELHRVLRHGGNLLMAVPLGWEHNPEHPYFLGPDEWLCLLEDAGFDLRVVQIGREYPEHGHDLFIAARKSRPAESRPRLDPDDFRKTGFGFVPIDDPSIAYDGTATVLADRVILEGDAWEIRVALPPGVREALPVFHRHNWSGIVQLGCGAAATVADLFSVFSWTQPVRLALPAPVGSGATLTIRPLGANRASWSSQGVICGMLLR